MMSATGGVRKPTRNPPRWHSAVKLRESRPWDAEVPGRKNRGSVHAVPSLGPEGGDHTATHEFYEEHTLDKVALPATADGSALDMRRVTSARGSPLYVLPTYRHLACIQHDAALRLRGREDLACRGDYARMDLANLEGCLLPWFAPLGRIRDAVTEDGVATPGKGKRCFRGDDDDAGFALRPVALATMADYEGDRSGSELVALGYVVSARAFNRFDGTGEDFEVSLNPKPVPHPRPVDPAAYCTAHYVLVVKSLGRLSLKMGPQNPLDRVLRWTEWADGPRPRTGLCDMLMHGGRILRAMLRGWRDEGQLEHHLQHGHAEARLKHSKQSAKMGLVVRKALLMEHVLTGTAMQYLWDGGEPPRELLDLRVPLPPDGAAGLYRQLAAWTADPSCSSWFGTV